MDIKHVTVAGGGVLGSQIAYQTAFRGFPVVLYDINEECVDKAKKNVKRLKGAYENDMHITGEQFEKGLANMTFSCDLSTAVKDADLVIEAIPEKLTIKENFYKQLSKAAPKSTIFASNSSTLLPSQLKSYTDRPDKYLHMHFANQIWVNNTAEIMGSPETDPKVFQEIEDFAVRIGMVPVPIHKEQPGYVLNSILVPWLNAALVLWAKGIADPWVIDRTWMIDARAPFGPFGVLDAIGLTTHYNIVCAMAQKSGNADLQLAADKMKERIDAGLLGPATGQGFYHWPNPECLQPGFLSEKGKK